MILSENFGELSDKATQQLIAPVFLTLYASVPLSIGDLFIFDNTLYKATADIAQDAAITIGSGGNAVEASTLSEERNFTGIDVNNVVHTFTRSTESTSMIDVDTWTATEDCYVAGTLFCSNTMVNNSYPAYVAYLDNSNNPVYIAMIYAIGTSSGGNIPVTERQGLLIPVKKGQTIAIRTMYNYILYIKAYGFLR